MVNYVQPKVRFKCTMCGECCRRYWITLTIDDLLAIYANAKLKPSAISALYDASIAGDWDSPKIRIGDRWYYLVLRKRIDGSCIFNEWRNGKLICAIHSFKPLVCRFYPFIYMWDGDVVKFEVYPAAVGYCPGLGKGPVVDLAMEAKYALMSREAKARFRAFADSWNRIVKGLGAALGIMDFLTILDCVVLRLSGESPECPYASIVDELIRAYASAGMRALGH